MTASRHAGTLLLAAGLLAAPAVAAQRAADHVPVPAGTVASVLAVDADPGPVTVPAFSMRVLPVARGEFQRFLCEEPGWQREQVARTFADAGYLAGWPATAAAWPDDAAAAQPATQVSWFAAQAYCESEGARLPTWIEWEYVAAADRTRADARSDPASLARILGWYARPASTALPPVGGEANVDGVRDVHGLVWEWVDDFNALLVDADSRSGNDPDKLKFCGAGAINLRDRQNYAVLMRLALLSSLNGADSTGSLGFRCARPASLEKP